MTRSEMLKEKERLFNEMMEMKRALRRYKMAKKMPFGSPERERIEKYPITEGEILREISRLEESYKIFVESNNL